jgi:hypothetical protein
VPEVVWHDLKAHHLAHQTLTDIAALDHAIHTTVSDLNRERMVDPLAEPRISAQRAMTRGCIAFPLPLIVSAIPAQIRRVHRLGKPRQHAGRAPVKRCGGTRARRLRKAQPRLGH